MAAVFDAAAGGPSEGRCKCFAMDLLHVEPMLRKHGPTASAIRAEFKKKVKSLSGKIEELKPKL